MVDTLRYLSLAFLACCTAVALLVVMSAVGAMPTPASMTMEHAQRRHGSDAMAIETAVAAGEILVQASNPATNRTAKVCRPDELAQRDAFGVMICDAQGEEVTSFPRKGHGLGVAGVVEYLLRRGFRIEGVTMFLLLFVVVSVLHEVFG